MCVIDVQMFTWTWSQGRQGIQGKQAIVNPDFHFRSPVRPLTLFLAVLLDLERLIVRHIRDIR